LIGGAGGDIFVFSKVSGRDTINDFDTTLDRILLENGIDVTMSSVSDVNRDGRADLTLTFSVGNAVTLLGVNDIGSVMIDRIGEPIAVAPLL
jgi:Ca2+-binding RTX toxin-like protein